MNDVHPQQNASAKTLTPLTLFPEHIVADDVQEHSSPSTPGENHLDRSPSQEIFGEMSHSRITISAVEKSFKVEEYIYIDFEEGDQRNPINFSRRKKWAITAIACFGTFLASVVTSAYSISFPSMIRDLHCTQLQAVAGLSVFALGFGVVPLVTASLSEEFGRLPLYIVSGLGFFFMFIMIALAKNIQTVIVARFLQGSFGSTAATMVGGTIADIWSTKERGLPMALFSFIALGATGLGPFYTGWIEINPKLEWRWIQWIHMIISGVYLLILPFVMKETRSSILLTKLAKKIRKTTGDHRYRARVEDERASLAHLVFISVTRPVHLMTTELVVASFSIWLGFAWGITFCMIESIPGVFETLHNFNIAQVGMVFIAMTIGSTLGFISNFYQEALYHRYFPTRGPEARLYSACCAAVMMPIAMFIYAWSSFPFVPWIALTIGIALYSWATFLIYLAVFSYLADCYGPYASSALAGQSLARNLSAAAFPLFTTQMFKALTFKWANTLFACFAVILVPIPFILFFYGPAVRRRSKFSRAVMEL